MLAKSLKSSAEPKGSAEHNLNTIALNQCKTKHWNIYSACNAVKPSSGYVHYLPQRKKIKKRQFSQRL